MKDIREYEAMAKLNLPDDQCEWVSQNANMLVDSFAALEGVDTDGVLPLVTLLDVQNVLREDVSVKMMPREELLENAPAQYGGYFQAPKTLE